MSASAFNWSDFFLCDFSSVSAENLQRKKPNGFFALALSSASTVVFDAVVFCAFAFVWGVSYGF